MSLARGPRAAAGLLLFASCWAVPHTPVPGPEEPGLLGIVRGTLLVREDWRSKDELQVFQLSSGSHRKLDLDHDVFAFSGVDEQGQFVYVRQDKSFFSGAIRHELRLASIHGGSERSIHSTSDIIAFRPAISRNGRYVAFFESKSGQRAELRLLDLVNQEDRRFPARPGNDLDWLEGDRALVRSVSVERGDVPEDLRADLPPPDDRWRTTMVSLVFVFDLDAGIDRPICCGVAPRPIPGRYEIAVAKEGESGTTFVVDARDGRRIREPIEMPGWARDTYWDRFVAALDPDHVLYVGQPTAGTEQRSYIPGNPLFREMMLPIKVADLSKGTFATVVPYVRPLISAYAPWEPSLP